MRRVLQASALIAVVSQHTPAISSGVEAWFFIFCGIDFVYVLVVFVCVKETLSAKDILLLPVFISTAYGRVLTLYQEYPIR